MVAHNEAVVEELRRRIQACEDPEERYALQEKLRKETGDTQASGNPKGANVLSDAQRDQMREWLAAGQTPIEVEDMCRRRGWPVVRTDTIRRMANSMGIKYKTLQQERMKQAMTTGFAIRAGRVEVLQRLADKLWDIILTDAVAYRERWAGNAASGKFVTDKVVNTNLVREFRRTLHQIAEEVGDVKPDFLLQSIINFLPEGVREAVIQLAQDSDESGTTE